MPILHIRALPQKDPSQIPGALKAATLAMAKVYGCDSSQVWATWEELKPGFYVEGESGADSQPEETHPPIADLICFEGSSPEQIEKVLLAASQALSRELGLGENIFIAYREAKSGQVIAGNGVVRREK